MPDRVLILAGAGASTAVNGSQFPTTIDFFKRLPEQITANDLFEQTQTYIRDELCYSKIDIEDILWRLDEGRRHLEGLRTGGSYAGYLLEPSHIRNTVGPAYNVGHLETISASLISSINELASDINKLVFDLYSYDPTPDELDGSWTILLRNLWGECHDLDIFTTNYDGVIENALLQMDLPSKEYYDFLGVTGTRRKYLDLSVWEGGVPEGKGLLTKLHGSVDWKLSGDRIYVSDPSFAGAHERHPIIYPGFKGESNSRFFKVFHTYFGEIIDKSNVLIFIGFAFRDEYINEKIRDLLRVDSKVIVINPDKAVFFPSNRHDVTYIREGFSQGSVTKLMKLIRQGRITKK